MTCTNNLCFVQQKTHTNEMATTTCNTTNLVTSKALHILTCELTLVDRYINNNMYIKVTLNIQNKDEWNFEILKCFEKMYLILIVFDVF